MKKILLNSRHNEQQKNLQKYERYKEYVNNMDIIDKSRDDLLLYIIAEIEKIQDIQTNDWENFINIYTKKTLAPNSRIRILTQERMLLSTLPQSVPLDKNILKNFKKVMINSDNSFCSICQEPIEKKTIIYNLGSCSCEFHIGCIDQWFATHDYCPNCRYNF